MYRATRTVTLLICTVLLLATGSRPTGSSVQASALQQADSMPLNITADRIEWQIGAAHHGAALTLGGPGGFTVQQTFDTGEVPTLAVSSDGSTLPDGVYTYQIVFSPGSPAIDPNPAFNGRAPSPWTAGGGEGFTMSGSFAILDGKFVVPAEEASPAASEEAIAPEDQVVADDLIVQNSLCVGLDCVNNMGFGADTIVLRENNLRIFFDDTSTGSFPRRAWRIVVNENTSGGLEKFSIHDATAGRTPFTIVGNAPADSIFVSSSGRLGLKTRTPALELHVADGDSPALRLQQTNAGGFTPQTWDIAGNEANFFVRDVTGGSTLPFRIRPGAPTSSIDINASGNVGVGTNSPQASFHVQRNNGTAQLMVKETSATNDIRTLLHLENNGTARIAMKNSPSNTWLVGVNNFQFFVIRQGSTLAQFKSLNNGDFIIAGNLTENAAAFASESESVSGGDLLPKLHNVPVVAWESEVQVEEAQETAIVRHMSPTAAGFHSTFNLGSGDGGISALDVASVAFAAAQELDAISKEQAAQIAVLQAENAELRARLAAIEAALGVEPTEPSTEPSTGPSTDPDEPTSSSFIPLVQQ